MGDWCLANHIWLPEDNWLVVGPPLWKIGVRQLGWLETQLIWENKKWQPNHQPDNIADIRRHMGYGARGMMNWIFHGDTTGDIDCHGNPYIGLSWQHGAFGFCPERSVLLWHQISGFVCFSSSVCLFPFYSLPSRKNGLVRNELRNDALPMILRSLVSLSTFACWIVGLEIDRGTAKKLLLIHADIWISACFPICSWFSWHVSTHLVESSTLARDTGETPLKVWWLNPPWNITTQ